MKSYMLALNLAILQCGLTLDLLAQNRKAHAVAEWCYASKGSLEVRPKAGGGKAPVLTLGQGAVVPGFERKRSGGRMWVRVQAVDPARMLPVTGWVDSTLVETLAPSQIPSDEDILKLLGGAFLEDRTAASAVVARYWLRMAEKEPALLCLAGGEVIPHTRLQVFFRPQEKLVPGPYIDMPSSDLQSAITYLEVRDLLGDGNDCFITREPYRIGPENFGVNMTIRRVEANGFESLWKAALEARNLASYPPKVQTLQPPELNIGRPGTDTSGNVEFRPRGALVDIVWKGKVNFHIIGREQLVESVAIEKTCSWDGVKFSPLH